ncbi:MAG: PQQ-binding-like beta-propeller repeat protein [Thermoplasmata archaeon]
MGRWTGLPPVMLAVVVAVLVLGSSSESLAGVPRLGSHDPTALSPGAHLDAGPAPWPTYMENPARTGANFGERAITPANVGNLTPIWSIADNGSDFSAPIVVNGTLYYGSWNGNETAVNLSTGAIEWRSYLGVDTACGGYTPMGISSTPAYLDGTIYLGGGNGFWYALNATTGATEWKYLVGTGANGSYNWASALVYRDALYIGVSSCFDDPLIPAGLLEVNLTGPHTPSHVFHSSPTGLTGESIWTSPAVDARNNTIWVTTGNENPPGYPIYANAVVALNATTLNVTGSWQVPNVAGEDADFGSTPVLFHTTSGTPLVVATDKNGIAYTLDRSNVTAGGTWGPVWSDVTNGGFSGATFDGHLLYLAGGSSVYAVDPGNGTVVWGVGMDGGGTIYGSLTWANGLVFAAGGSEVEAIDAANGTVAWNATLPGGEDSVTEPVVADGRLFVASGDYGTSGHLTAYGLPDTRLYSVTFTEKGLPLGTRWSVTAGVTTVAATTASLAFHEPNGTVGYAANPSVPYLAQKNATGAVLVAGLAIALSISYNFTALVTFSESGLPSGTGWAVGVLPSVGPAQANRSNGATITFREPNATFRWSAMPPDDYSASPSNGSFRARGTAIVVSVRMEAAPAPGPTLAEYGLLAAGVGILLIAVAIVVRARRQRNSVRGPPSTVPGPNDARGPSGPPPPAG